MDLPIDDADTGDEWEGLGTATYTIDGGSMGRRSIQIVITKVVTQGGLRLAERKRPYRPGVKLDDTGRKGRVYKVDCIFHNDVTEETVGKQMWPDRADTFGEMLEESQQVGTLDLPWKRNIKVRCDTYERVADAGQHRGGETFAVTWLEDNEERMSDGVQNVTVKGRMASAVDDLVSAAAAAGAWDGGIEDLVQLAAQVTALINAPGEYLEGVLASAKALERACVGIKNALTANLDGSDKLQDPSGSSLFDCLTELQDMAGRVAGEAAASLPKLRTVRFTKDRTIYDIAAELSQSSRDLIAANPDLEDPGYIPAGTPVQVFA